MPRFSEKRPTSFGFELRFGLWKISLQVGQAVHFWRGEGRIHQGMQLRDLGPKQQVQNNLEIVSVPKMKDSEGGTWENSDTVKAKGFGEHVVAP